MEINSIPLLLATKWVGLIRRWQFRSARIAVSRKTPELLVAYAAFGCAQQSGSPRQPFKGWDIWKILQIVRPQSIHELGSGTTSAVFALWSKQTGAKYTAFEHHDGWAKVSQQCLAEAGLPLSANRRIVCIPTKVKADQSSVGFEQPLPLDADFLYIDGPPCVIESGLKVPNDDATRLLDQGGLPKAIVVDGRIETVDLLLKHPAIAQYRFFPSLVYCRRKGLFLKALAGREHSVFIRK